MRTFQDIEADAAKLVDVRVEDFGKEADLGRGHGVVVGEEELELEGTACGRMMLAMLAILAMTTFVQSLANLGMGRSQVHRW